MKLSEVKDILHAVILLEGERWATAEVQSACGSDLMSDVLAFTKGKTLLLTGLTNPQAIRTAELADLVGVVFVRGKHPEPETVKLAERVGIPLLATSLPMYEACGLLYRHGLPGIARAAGPHAAVANRGRQGGVEL